LPRLPVALVQERSLGGMLCMALSAGAIMAHALMLVIGFVAVAAVSFAAG
jgi:hypothetical protein